MRKNDYKIDKWGTVSRTTLLRCIALKGARVQVEIQE